jgi:hypothetical protein
MFNKDTKYSFEQIACQAEPPEDLTTPVVSKGKKR